MISTLFQFAKVIVLIIRYGRIFHSGRNFNEERSEGLKKIKGVTSTPQAHPNKIKLWLWKNALTRNLLVQASYFKNSLRKQRGHLYSPSLKLSYIRIPKSASTSVSLMMLQSIHKTLQEQQLSSTEINFLTDAFLSKEISEAEKESRFFTIVRNPFARIVSVYRDFFESSSDNFIYQDYLFGIFSKGISFQEFVHRLESIPDALKDQHLKPQYLFPKYYEKRISGIAIFKLEKSNEIQSFLSTYNLRLPFINTSQEPYDYRFYYDKATFDVVSLIYERDIKVFHYEAEAEMLKDFLSIQKAGL